MMDVAWASVAVAALSALGATIGALAAYKNVMRRRRTDHEDASCLRMKRVFENSHDGKLVVNRDLVVVAANKQARAITGYTDLVGRSVYELIPERFHDVHRKHVQRFFNDPHTRRMGVAPMQLWLIDRFGVEKLMHLSLSPSEDEYGGMETAIGMQVIQD